MSGVTAPELCACARGLQVTGAAAGGPRHAVAELFLSWVRARCALCSARRARGSLRHPARNLIISRASTSNQFLGRV